MKKIKTALISVSDKKNLRILLKNLSKHKIKIVSSGGTFNKVKNPFFILKQIDSYRHYITFIESLEYKITNNNMSNIKYPFYLISPLNFPNKFLNFKNKNILHYISFNSLTNNKNERFDIYEE